MYQESFDYLHDIVVKDANVRLFHNAKDMYDKVGRGSFFLLYTQPEQVFTHTGLAPARFLPTGIIEMEEENAADIVAKCNEYDPRKQFVIVFEIGQRNDLDKPVVQKIEVIDYIGKKAEKSQELASFSLFEFEHRLDKKKSMPCDNCMQRRRLTNMMLDPVIGRLVYCNQTCYEEGLKKGDVKLIDWYLKNKDTFNLETDIQRGPSFKFREVEE